MRQVKERGGVEMSYCPTLQLLQSRETWGPFFSKVPPSLQGRVYLKPRVRKKKPRRTPNDYEVLVIWVRRLSGSSFSSGCTSFLTLITKLQSHSAWTSVPDSRFYFFSQTLWGLGKSPVLGPEYPVKDGAH